MVVLTVEVEVEVEAEVVMGVNAVRKLAVIAFSCSTTFKLIGD